MLFPSSQFISRAPRPVHSVVAVDFDGTNDYLTRGADLTGLSDGKTGLISCWFNLAGGDNALQYILTAVGFFVVERTNENKIRIGGFNSDATLVLDAETAATHTSSAGWKHLLSSYDLSTGDVHLYIDSVSDRNDPSLSSNKTIDYTRGNFSAGGHSAGGNKWNGDLAELWFHDTYLDLSVAGNRSKFIVDGKPAALGSSGELPTGTSPRVYLSGPLATWHTNDGTGGGFTENGALTLASTSPSD